MKRYIVTALVSLIAFGSMAQVKKTATAKSPTAKKAAAKKTVKTTKPVQMLPDFSFSKVPDSTIFTKDSLQKDKKTILMFFNPECGHCMVVLKAIFENYKLFEGCQIVMGAPSEHKILQKFYDDYKLADYPGITLCRDKNYFLVTHFDLREYPGVYIFNKKGQFVKGLTNDVKLEEITEALKKAGS